MGRDAPGFYPQGVPLLKKGAATYSPALRRSTIGAAGLNFSVRDGKRWGTGAVATQYVSLFLLLFHLAFLTASASWGG